MVNATIKLPRLPGWLNMERCAGCGSQYRAHRGVYDFQMAAQRVRQAAEADGDTSGGYRSAGPVLWALRVLKTEDWLLAHLNCGDPNAKPSEDW